MTYVAFLRGINSGKNPSTKMGDLKKAFESLGFENVKTILATGNVIFDSPATNPNQLANQIQSKLTPLIGFASATTIREFEELKKFVASNPFASITETPKTRLQVTFLKGPVRTKMTFPSFGVGYTILGIFQNTLCSVVDLTQATTPDLMKILDKEFGKEITTRTWQTILKIVAAKND